MKKKLKICMFHHIDTSQFEIAVCDALVKSKDHMNKVNVMFDSKLTWAKRISIKANKPNSALHAIKLIRKYV